MLEVIVFSEKSVSAQKGNKRNMYIRVLCVMLGRHGERLTYEKTQDDKNYNYGIGQNIAF